MQAKGRIQINIQMTRIPEIPQASKLADVLIPVIWIEDVWNPAFRDLKFLFIILTIKNFILGY